MSFPTNERAALLQLKGVGPTVIRRLEEIGIHSLRNPSRFETAVALARQNVGTPTRERGNMEPVKLSPIVLRALNAGSDTSWFSHTLISQGGANLRYRAMRDTCATFHQHTGHECFVVLSGIVHFDIEGGDTVAVTAGQFFAVPPGVRHRARVEGEATLLVFDGEH